jgi:hypothetical protein
MTVASTSDFVTVRDEMCNAILRKVTGLPDGFQAYEMENALYALQLTVKSLQNKGIMLWTREWTTKTLSAPSEYVGSDTLNYTCRRGVTTASTNKPITGANWTTYFEQTGSSGIAWSDGLTATSANEIDFDGSTIGVEIAMLRDTDTDSKLDIITFAEYMALTDKFITGEPTKIAFTKDQNGILKGYLYPQPDVYTYVVHLLSIRKLRDFDSDTDNPDFPVRWYKYLIWQTAADIAPEYKVNTVDRQHFMSEAERQYRIARGAESEDTDIDFVRPYA